MYKLLKNDGFELYFIKHNLIAYTKNVGINKFTPNAKTITEIKEKYKDKDNNPIELYLKANPTEGDPNFYQRRLETYMMSCIGQTMASYLLGIGDRHLENLMIT